ncbi:histidine phosphatase family protein [Falsiroseomonas oryziterrae]|uniref:histidine phosphatase family protein n=1 Tax=Falsiroseomonas oryziterrae TaxID=2911368 RepID=UPI001F1CA5B4|nr:histidine phosphatase family protein [Roseomonas sp. NPKOSM-4]
MALRLLLTRHAAHGDAGRVLSGRTDRTGLSEEGRAQASRLARRLRRDGPRHLVASPRRRAQETARILGEALRLEPRSDPALDEIEFGAWTGRSFAELGDAPGWPAWNEQRAVGRAPGGEAMHEVQSRVLVWAEGLHASGLDGAVVAVSHADVIKAAVCAYLGLSLDAHLRFDIAPGSLSGIELWQGGGRVLFVNEAPAPEAWP